MKTGRTNRSIRPISVGELKWGNGASPDWLKRKCLSEGEHCMCVQNTGGVLHKEKWMCIYIKSIKLLMGAVQPEGKIDRFTPQTHQYNLKHVFEALPIHKRNGARLNYCVHRFITDHCSFTPSAPSKGSAKPNHNVSVLPYCARRVNTFARIPSSGDGWHWKGGLVWAQQHLKSYLDLPHLAVT